MNLVPRGTPCAQGRPGIVLAIKTTMHSRLRSHAPPGGTKNPSNLRNLRIPPDFAGRAERRTRPQVRKVPGRASCSRTVSSSARNHVHVLGPSYAPLLTQLHHLMDHADDKRFSYISQASTLVRTSILSAPAKYWPWVVHASTPEEHSQLQEYKGRTRARALRAVFTHAAVERLDMALIRAFSPGPWSPRSPPV